MISEKAVEAAAWAYVRTLPGYVEGVSEAPLPREVKGIRAALQVALPILLEGKREQLRSIVEDAMESAIQEPWDVSNHAANRIISILTGDAGA